MKCGRTDRLRLLVSYRSPDDCQPSKEKFHVKHDGGRCQQTSSRRRDRIGRGWMISLILIRAVLIASSARAARSARSARSGRTDTTENRDGSPIVNCYASVRESTARHPCCRQSGCGCRDPPSYSDVVWRSAPEHGKMFHVEQEGSDSNHVMAVAEQIFGDRLELARRYHDSLATAGVERGLIGPREVPRLWERHILNCAAIGELIDEGETVVDIGSGAGLPGIPLAIARPDLRVTLVEPLLRRTVYLAEFIEEHDLNILVVRGRAEQPGVKKEAGGADVVTSRAVAPLEKLAKWSLPLVHEHGRMLALKGSSAGEEIERDRTSLARMGAGKLEVVECGVGLLPTPTIVVRAVREPRRLSRH